MPVKSIEMANGLAARNEVLEATAAHLEFQDAAVQTVLQQAEVLSASWQPGHSRA